MRNYLNLALSTIQAPKGMPFGEAYDEYYSVINDKVEKSLKKKERIVLDYDGSPAFLGNLFRHHLDEVWPAILTEKEDYDSLFLFLLNQGYNFIMFRKKYGRVPSKDEIPKTLRRLVKSTKGTSQV